MDEQRKGILDVAETQLDALAIGYPFEIAFANTAKSGVTPTNS